MNGGRTGAVYHVSKTTLRQQQPVINRPRQVLCLSFERVYPTLPDWQGSDEDLSFAILQNLPCWQADRAPVRQSLQLAVLAMMLKSKGADLS